MFIVLPPPPPKKKKKKKKSKTTQTLRCSIQNSKNRKKLEITILICWKLRH